MATRTPMAGRAPMTDAEARTQVAKEKKFYASLATYAVVMAGLAVLNLLTSPGYLWVVWPLLGWGLGVASQAAKTFGMPGMRGWEERRLQTLAGATASEARLRRMLDETLDERAVPAGAPQDADRLQRRIEHLEAIVTSRDWDAAVPDFDAPAVRAPAAPEARLPDALLDADDDTPADRAARLARRVR